MSGVLDEVEIIQIVQMPDRDAGVWIEVIELETENHERNSCGIIQRIGRESSCR